MIVTAASLAELLGVPLRDHPDRSGCATRAAEWVRAHGDLDGGAPPAKVEAWGFGGLAAAMYPDAGVATVALAADFTHWIAVVDDRVERDAAEIDRLRAGGPLAPAWDDLARRLGPGPGLDAQRDALFEAYRWEWEFRARGTAPTLDAFRTHRHVSGGLPFYLRILAGACGDAPAGRAELDRRIGTLTCWANDLLSHDWDRDTDNPINLVRVCGSLQAAVGAFEEEWHGWQALRGSDPAFQRSRYVAAQPALVAGTLAWMERTARYRASGRTAR